MTAGAPAGPDALAGLAYCRLDQVPALDGPAMRAALRPALAGAYAAGEPVCLLWWRPVAGGPVRIVAGGDPAATARPYADGGTGAGVASVSVPYPAGARGTALDTSAVLADLAALPCWLACEPVVDALVAAEPPGAGDGDDDTASFEDYLAHLGGAAFCWLVLAEPVTDQQAAGELTRLNRALAELREQSSGRAAVERERVEARYRELAAGAVTGLWTVRVLVAGADERAARRAAGLLCAAADLAELPYRLRPPGGGVPVSGLDAAVAGGPAVLTGTDLVAALARPPLRELPGVRRVESVAFDLMPESGGSLTVGDLLDPLGQPAGTFSVGTATLNRHAFVAGATGAGKSQTIRHLLEGLHAVGIPWLVIEPAKAEYARMAGRLGSSVAVIRPGAPDAPPVGLNPLAPEPGFPLQTHVDLVRALFLAAFEAHEPFPQVLARAMTRCYEDRGWDLSLGEPRLAGSAPAYPTLGDLQRVAHEVVSAVGYGAEVTADVRGFIDIRLGSLRLGTPGRFFEGGHPLDMADLLGRDVVLELQDVGNDQDKAFFIGAVLIRLTEHLRVRSGTADSAALRHVTVVEEAHRLLKASAAGTPAAHAVELFAGLLAEIRAYGEGVVIAEQIPAKILPDVLKNTALKIVHRLPAADDRASVGATVNLADDQSRHLVTLPPGQAVAFADGMDRPVLVRVPLGEDRERAEPSPPTVATAASRAAGCPDSCRTQPCTLRDIARAREVAADPRLTLWIELLTLAHLTGEPAPVPDPQWLVRLRFDHERRRLHCALAHLTQSAVDTRYPAIVDFYTPDTLATHIAAQARALVAGNPTPCASQEPEWQAGRYRYVDVSKALLAAVERGSRGRHPDTDDWAAHRGLHLPGETAAQQLAAWRQHPHTRTSGEPLLSGTATPPAHETAAAQLSTAPTAPDRLTEAASFLAFDTFWPRRELYQEDLPDA
ncbi:MAG: ATP-binding protein [Mycobacteriales bacterium]